ncbi:hypothetical protein C9J01_24330 [Photobacterium rosenbergii]|uniref:Uncharacterized protein n=1 Tax=Photobacterium rosenbergii TaxID=294936 RepID=A0A2T3N6H5_9GAMM|nr:hypothetical protein [Photobacterium rosenbergii]PSW08301.1 hypothetical protein C9J01_24330 [Photobacterium rosenbergii]
MKKTHVGFNIPGQENVYIERFYNDEGTVAVNTILSCPDANWSYSMDILSEEEFELLTDRDVHQSDKEGIYIQHLGGEVIEYFTFY